MSPKDEPKTQWEARAAGVILRWVAGIAAAVIGTLIVVVLMGTARAVVSHGDRITRVEALNESRDKTLDRIESQLAVIDKKLDELK